MPDQVPYLDENGHKRWMKSETYIRNELEKELKVRDDIAEKLADKSEAGLIPRFIKAVNGESSENTLDNQNDVEYNEDDSQYAYSIPKDKYWYPKLTQREWNLLNRTIKKELPKTDKYLDDVTKWLYAEEKGVRVFAIYGIGDGTEETILYACGGKSAYTLNLRREEYESKLNRTKRNPFRRHIERVGVERIAYENRVDSVRSVSGDAARATGELAVKDRAISLEPQRGNNRSAIQEDSGDVGDSSYSFTPSQRDTEYLDAVNRGDMETAQRMVDEAAKGDGESDTPKIKSYFIGMNDSFSCFLPK